MSRKYPFFSRGDIVYRVIWGGGGGVACARHGGGGIVKEIRIDECAFSLAKLAKFDKKSLKHWYGSKIRISQKLTLNHLKQ